MLPAILDEAELELDSAVTDVAKALAMFRLHRIPERFPEFHRTREDCSTRQADQRIYAMTAASTLR